MEPVRFQVIFWVEPTAQTSPLFGAVKTKAPLMMKLASDVSETEALLTSVILTRRLPLIAYGTVQLYVPRAAFVVPTIKLGNVAPELVEYSNLTLAMEP